MNHTKALNHILTKQQYRVNFEQSKLQAMTDLKFMTGLSLKAKYEIMTCLECIEHGLNYTVTHRCVLQVTDWEVKHYGIKKAYAHPEAILQKLISAEEVIS